MTVQLLDFLFIDLPIAISCIAGIVFTIHKCKEFAKKPFVCPNCGNTFRVSWQRLFFNLIPLLAIKKAPLKCVHCERKDLCRWKEETP